MCGVFDLGIDSLSMSTESEINNQQKTPTKQQNLL